MSLQQQVIQRLEQLVSQGPQSIEAVMPATPDKGYIIGVPADEHGRSGVSLNLADYDRYSVTLRHLEVFNQTIGVESVEVENYLRQVATEISQRLTYLEEPLTLVELNMVDNIAQLRSSPPQQQSLNESTYWEVMLYVTPHPHARLTRYRWTADSHERVAMAYPATFAMLGRLAEDLVESLGVVCDVNRSVLESQK